MCKIKYLMAVENYSEAKECSTTYLDKYGNNPEGIYYMKKANEMIMMDFKKKADEGDAESLLELGWCLFQNEQFDECISMLEEYKPDEEHEFDYNNLRGRCTLASGRYKEALPFLEKWLAGIIELKDDGTEKYRKRIRRLGYANYTVSMSYASIGEELTKDNKYEQGIDKYNTAIEYMREAIETEKELREVIHYRERLAFLLTKADKNEEAIDICDRIVEEESQYYPAYCTRQYAYYNLRHGQGVIDDFYNAIEIYNGNAEPYVLAIKAFMGYEQYDDAENIINMAKEAGVQSDDITLQKLIIRRCKNVDDDESVYDSILEGLLELENKVFVRNEETDIDVPVEITYQIGLLYADRKMLEKALNIMDKCYKQSNDTKYLWVKAGINERFGKDADALEVFNEMEKIITDDDELYYRIGRCMERLGKSNMDKMRYYMKAYELNPNHRAVNDCISQICNDRFNNGGGFKEYEDAIKYANNQINVNPGSYVLINRGLIFLDGGEIDKAIADFEEALRYDSEDMYAYNNIGYANKRIKNYDKAIEYYKKGIEVETEDSKRLLYKNLYLAYLISGRYEEATELLDVFIENDKNKTDVVEMIAEVYGRQHKFEKSIELKKEYEDEQLDKVSFYISQAEDYLHLGNKKEAKANYTKAKKFLDSEGDKREYYDSLVNYYIFAEDSVKKAIDVANKSIKAQETVNTYTALCRLYYRIGKKDKVNECYEKAIKLIKKKWGTIDNYIRFPRWRTLHLFIMGLLNYYTGNYDEAEKYFNDMENSPHCSMCHYDKCYERLLGKGLIEIYKGNKKEALEILREASSIAPTFFEAEEEIKELER